MKMLMRWVVAVGCLTITPWAVLGQEQGQGQGQGQAEPSKVVKTQSGLQYQDVTVGKGQGPTRGATCSMHYTGWLWENGKKGKKFDSSLDTGKPFDFAIGQGQVIAGWDEGVMSMKPGGKRMLLIPPALGYGEAGAGGVIPPNATLLFEVELLRVR